MSTLCEEPLIERFFSILGRLGLFSLLLDPANQLTVLFHLYYHGDRIMRQIAEKLRVSDPTATGIIDRLTEKGLVERFRDLEDRRRVIVGLTETGRRQIAEIRCAGAEPAASVFYRLTVSQRDALYASLGPVCELLAVPAEADSV